MQPPQDWRRARATLGFAGASVLAWLVAAGLGLGAEAAIWGGFIPARVSGLVAGPLAPVWLTPFTATLVHAGLVHLAFNMLMLLFCGRAIEAILGVRGMILLYIVGAYVAAATQYAVDPHETIPMVGASGAISAVLGAYAMLFGRNRVRIANPTIALWVNALWLAAAWIGLQLLMGVTFEIGSKIAIFAHIGGFMAGLIMAKPLILLRYRKA